jgi:hypothetical protein
MCLEVDQELVIFLLFLLLDELTFSGLIRYVLATFEQYDLYRAPNALMIVPACKFCSSVLALGFKSYLPPLWMMGG